MTFNINNSQCTKRKQRLVNVQLVCFLGKPRTSQRRWASSLHTGAQLVHGADHRWGRHGPTTHPAPRLRTGGTTTTLWGTKPPHTTPFRPLVLRAAQGCTSTAQHCAWQCAGCGGPRETRDAGRSPRETGDAREAHRSPSSAWQWSGTRRPGGPGLARCAPRAPAPAGRRRTGARCAAGIPGRHLCCEGPLAVI